MRNLRSFQHAAMTMSADEVFRVLSSRQSAENTRAALARLVDLVKSERSTQKEFEINAETFVSMVSKGYRCIDVRSPGEFAKGHIPGAENVPLFTDSERAAVGTCYKHSGREEAMALGMSKVAEKGLEDLAIRAQGSADLVCVHCWRGGLRSGAVAWMLRRRGVKAYCLVGGYKSFRAWVRALFSVPEKKQQRHSDDNDDRLDDALDGDQGDTDCSNSFSSSDLAETPRLEPPVVMVAGRTGVGKTRVLLALRDVKKQQVIDLEGLAKHRGSAFGGFVSDEQPSNEFFENQLALQWRALDPTRPVFIEDEEGHVGKCSVPPGLYEKMRKAPTVCRIVASIDTRVKVLLDDYASSKKSSQSGGSSSVSQREEEEDDDSELLASTHRISKRLGGDRTKHAIDLLQSGDKRAFAEFLLLNYYDKLYDAHLDKRHVNQQTKFVDVPVPTQGDYDAVQVATNLLDYLSF